MAGINVGTAFVTIIPSARGFKNNLRKELSGELELLARNAGKTLEKGIAKAKLKQTLEKSLSIASTASLVASLASVSGAAVTLASSLIPVAGAVTALPAAAGVGAAAMGTLKLGIQGVSDAFSAFADGDPKKIEKALEGLTPSARKFVKDFAKGMDGLQDVAQESMFKPLSKVSDETAKTLRGPLKAGLKDVGAELGAAGAQVVKFAGSAHGVNLVNGAFKNAEKFIAGARSGLGPLMAGIADLADVFFPKIGKSGEAVGDIMSKLGSWLSEIASSGQAMAWWDQAREAAGKLWGIAKNLLTTLTGIFGASDSGGDMLGTLEKLSKKMSDWVNSAGGQEKLAQTFQTLNQILNDLAGVFAIVGGGVATLVGWFNQLDPGVQSAITQTIAWGGALKLLSGPIGGLVSAGGSVVGFFRSSGGEASRASKIYNGLKTAIGNGVARVQLYAEAAGGAAKRMGTAIGNGAKTAGTWFGSMASKAGTAASSIGSRLASVGSSAAGMASRAGSALSGLASRAGTAASTLGGKLATLGGRFATMAGQAAAASGKAVAGLARMAAAGAASIAKSIASLAALGAKWVWYGIMAMANAIRAAAAWVISLGPIAWIIAAVVALVALIIVYWDEIVAALEAAWEWISSLAKTVWGAIVSFFKTVWDKIVAVFEFVWNLIVSIVKTYFMIVFTIIQTVINTVKAIWDAIWNGIVTTFKFVWNLIVSVVRGYIQMMLTIITTVINAVWGFIKGAWDTIVSVFRQAVQLVVALIQGNFQKARALVVSIFTTIWNFIKSVWNGIKTAIRTAVNAVINFILGIGKIPGKVVAFFTRMKDGAVEKFKALVSWAKGLPGKVLSALGKIGSKLLSAGKDLINGLLKGMKNAASSVFNWIKGLLKDVKDKVLSFFGIKSPSRLMMYVGDMIVAGLVKGLERGENAALRAAQAIADAARPDVDTTFGGGFNGIGGTGIRYAGNGTIVENMNVTAVGRPISLEELNHSVKYTGVSS